MPAAWFSSVNWRAAMWLGLVTSTFSTVVSTLTAMRLGRDAAVDWMVVAAIPFRDPALQVEPSAAVVVAGLLFHQWADFSWTVVFFGLLGRWTGRLRPQTIALLAAPWALCTSSLEWLFLVPILPFWQPIFTLEQVYWLGLFVHLLSASMYPLFPAIRDRLAGLRPSPNRRFANAWAAMGVAIVAVVAVLAAFGAAGRELPWHGEDLAGDQRYMRQMAAHHGQGVELARLAAERARDPHLRSLARLMAASQTAEIEVFGHWWRSWFDEPLPPASPGEHMAMPGMLSPAEMQRLRDAAPAEFDGLFVQLMSKHHRGAVVMSEHQLRRRGDLRVQFAASAIRHSQNGEIALMHGLRPGWRMLRLALQSLLPPSPEVHR